jgi:hypothetical protein
LEASGEQRSDGSSKSLVGSITKSDGALAEFVGLEGVDAVADNRIVEEMLEIVSLHRRVTVLIHT